jgi:polyhydroxyalkanoate synthesis regulator phasin
MKSILEIIYALLVGLIGDDVSEEVTKALADLKSMIDELEDETKSEDEVVELENKIQAQLNNLLPKIENVANKSELAKLKNQLANLQKVMLDKAVRNLASNQKPPKTGKMRNAAPYRAGERTKLVNLISIDEELIPTFIEQEVISTIPENADFIADLDYRGNVRSTVFPIDDYQDDEEVDRAGAWTGSGAAKKKMVASLAPKRINTQPLYVLAGISWEELETNGGMLPKYRVATTLRRWREEYMRAILVGDGRNPSSDRHITTLVPIKRSASDAFCTVVSPTAPPTVKSVRAAIVANVKRSYEAILVANATTINKLQEISTATGIVTYMSDEELAKILKVKRVVTNEWLADNEIAVFRNYGTIGTSSPSTIEDYEITTNTDWFEVIGFVGGDLYSPHSALWINAPAEETGLETISIDPATVKFAAAGETKIITVTASSAYEIASKPEWITGLIEGNTVTLTAEANNTGADRTGQVVFTLVSDATVTATLAVSQLSA